MTQFVNTAIAALDEWRIKVADGIRDIVAENGGQLHLKDAVLCLYDGYYTQDNTRRYDECRDISLYMYGGELWVSFRRGTKVQSLPIGSLDPLEMRYLLAQLNKKEND